MLGPLRPNFVRNNCYQQNSIPITTSQNVIMIDNQNDFQHKQQQRSQFPMRMQEERPSQDFQNEISPQNNKSKQEITKKEV